MLEEDAIFVGIDPGKNGALAAIRGSELTMLVPFRDDGESYIHVFRRLSPQCDTWPLPKTPVYVMVEKVWAMPHEGVSSAFSFGVNFGLICGIAKSFGFDVEYATPQQWQKHFGVTGDKQEHIAKAKELFPAANLKRTPRCKKDHDGFADAILIAEYLRSVKCR